MKGEWLIKLFADSIKSKDDKNKGKNIAKVRQYWMLDSYTNCFLKVLSITIKHVILYNSSLLRQLYHWCNADCQLIIHIFCVWLH